MATTEVPASNTDEGKPWHLSGNNAPVFDELTVTELEVKGLSLIHISEPTRPY